MTEETDDNLLTGGDDDLPESASRQTDVSETTTSEDQDQTPPISPERPVPLEPEIINELGGIKESLRGEDGTLRTVQFTYFVPSGSSGIFQEMVAQGQYARDPLQSSPIPTGRQEYGSTAELFSRIKLAIVEQTKLPDQSSALATFWILSTWFQDILPIAPGLALTGWAHSGDVILRALRTFCYHPILIAGITSTILNDLNWHCKPTLLISDPSLNRRMAVLLGSSTSRGYLTFRKLAGGISVPFDYFSSKAIFLGEDSRMASTLQHYLHINASPVPRANPMDASPLSEKAVQDFQNQLLRYRLKNLPRAHTSNFHASGLSPEITLIANSFGRCIVDAPELQAELITLLMPISDHQHAESIDELGALAIVAALTLCHAGKEEILVGEIAAEVNRILKERGERQQHSPEKVGHRLRKAGLLTRRLGAKGNGLLLDRATKALLHDAAITYGCGRLNDPNENHQCPLCTQNK